MSAHLRAAWRAVRSSREDDPFFVKRVNDRVRTLAEAFDVVSPRVIVMGWGTDEWDGSYDPNEQEIRIYRPHEQDDLHGTIDHEFAHYLQDLQGLLPGDPEDHHDAAFEGLLADVQKASGNRRIAFSAPIPARVRAKPPKDLYAPRPVKIEERAEGDIRHLDTDDEGEVRDIIREIARGKVMLDRKERPPLEDCFSADAGVSVRILLYPHIDGSWRVFYVGYHEYDVAERRLERAASVMEDEYEHQAETAVQRTKLHMTRRDLQSAYDSAKRRGDLAGMREHKRDLDNLDARLDAL